MKIEKKCVFKIFILLVFATTLISCASTPKQSGFLGEHYNNLQPGPKGGGNLRWLKPGVDFGKYNKVMINNIVYFFADESDYKGIDPVQMQALSEAFKQEIVDVYKDSYPIVSEPGPDVACLKIALTGLKQSRPVLSGITTVIPVGLVVSGIKKGTTGAWTGSGATRAEIIVIDSVSNEIIAVAQDEQHAGFTKRFSKYGSAEEAFKFWAKRLRAFTDQSHGIKPKNK